METADPLNPSSKADAAEDLIEELARLMADDAQINTPTPAAAGARAVTPGLVGQNAQKSSHSPNSPQTSAQSFASGQGGQQGANQQGASQQNTGQQNSGEQGAEKAATNKQSASSSAEHKPFIGNFDLGQPQAEVSPVPKLDASVPGKILGDTPIAPASLQAAPSKVKLEPIDAAIADLTQTQDVAVSNTSPDAGTAQNQSTPKGKLDFDFGFGVGPEGAQAGETAPINMPVNVSTTQPEPISSDTLAPNEPTAGAPSSDIPVLDMADLDIPDANTQEFDTQGGDDPIAALINAAVTKHSGVDTDAEMSAAELVSADMPLRNETQNAQNSDGFETPPVFGMEGVPSTPVGATPKNETFARPIGGSTALDDIEALIGNSINVSPQGLAPEGDISAQQAVEGPPLAINTPAKEHPARASIAPMSGTPDAPVANNRNPETSILDAMAGAGTAAAAGASYAKGASAPGGVVAREQAEPLLAAGRVKTQSAKKKGLPKILVPMLGVLLLGAAGVAGYMYLNQPQQNGDAPILLADTTPTRVEPAPVETAGQSVVLNEIDGTSTPPQDEQLVSRDETDGATGEVVRQVITEDNSEAGLANRRVRTVTVRPDGTIVSGSDTAAGSQVLPVEQPNLPDLPADAVNTELSNTTVAALPESASELAIQNPNLVTVNGDSVPFPQPALTNRAALRTAALARETQLPVTTGVSSNTETSVVNLINDASTSPLPTTPVNVTPEAIVASTPAPTTNVSNPQAYVQLASQRSQSVANQTASTMQSRYSSALKGGSLLVRRVDLGTRGIYYRVQLPTSSLSEANSICSAIKNAGGDCFTRNS